ncbi:MFS general substrate transporter [Naviculisporaceae sp. PSN 640]
MSNREVEPFPPCPTAMPPSPPEPGVDMGIERIDWADRHPADQRDGPNEQPRSTIESLQIEEPARPFERVYLEGVKLHIILVCIVVATFLLMLDTSVIATAVPSITDEFDSLADLGWYSGVYQLACAVFQPLTGRIFQRLPLGATYISFFVIFMIGSLLCGAAVSSDMLILGRGIAGLGGAGVTTGALTIIATIAPPQRANEHVSVVMSFSHLGIVMGPIVGGLFSEYVTWRWCFYVNLPVGALVLPMLLLVKIPEQMEKESPLAVLKTFHQQVDLVGFALFTPFTIQLLLALQYAGSGEYAWTSPLVITLFCASGVFLIAWAIWSHFIGRSAIIPLYILKPRVVWTSVITQCLLMTAVYVITIFLSMYFQAIKDFPPFKTGLNMLAGVLSQLFLTITASRIIVRSGFVGLFATIAALFTIGSNAAYAFLQVASPPAAYLGYQVLNGVGRGLGMQTQITAINFSLPPADNAVAMAVLMFTQFLTTAIMQVVASVLFLEALKSGLASKVPQVNAAAVIAAGARDFRKVVAAADLPAVLEVYLHAISMVFWLICGLGGLAVVSGLMMGRVHPPPEDPATRPPSLRER